jgi:tetratricopeptide (TPR) repeat protein
MQGQHRFARGAWAILALMALALPAHAQEAAQAGDEAAQPATSQAAARSAPGAALDADAAQEEPAQTKPWSHGVPMAQREAARALFLEGNRYLDIPLFAQAAEKYQEALALWPHPAFHFNLALAQLNLVQPVEAYESFGRAMAHASDGIGEDKHRLAEDYRHRLEQRLGRIEVTCDEPGAEVTLDGRPLFVGPGRFSGVVLPGEHQIVASRAGFIPETRRIVVSAGERNAVALVLQRPAHTVTERYLPAWIPWASLGLSAAVLGVGGYFDRSSQRSLAAFDALVTERCPRGCTPDIAPELPPRHASAERERHLAQGLYLTGGIVLAGSAVLLYLNRERVVSRPEPDDSLSFQPWLAPDGAGVAAQGRF